MRTSKFFSLILIMLSIIMFQNCQKAGFSSTADVLSMSSFSTDTVFAETEMNTPVEFNLKPSTSFRGVNIEITAANNSALKGSFQLLDSNSLKIKYQPEFGFRGHEKAVINLSDAYGNKISVYAIVNVGNPLSGFEPALAVRGMGCIQCHANVNSNIVTDFGFGDAYYFGQQPSGFKWNSGSVYGDHSSSFDTILTASDKSIIVPIADLPETAKSQAGSSTLAGYLRNELNSSSSSTTKATSVTEKSNVYIGAPMDSDLVSAFALSSMIRWKYYPNSDDSVTLSGLADQGTYFKMTGPVSCDGDLVLRGPLYIENLVLETTAGCRLYVIGSVFTYGPITYLGSEDKRNLQITSTKSINMGLGSMKKNGAFCDPTSRYATDTTNYGVSSLTNRLKTFWTVPGNFVRQSSNPVAFGSSILAEAQIIEAAQGTLYDASCRAEGRKVSYERLLINAPIIHSRYEGNFKGTVISEFAIMTLGAFVFEFDPVFSKVSVFPFLDPRHYLVISN